MRRALQRQTGRGLVLVEPKSRAGRRTISLPPRLVAALRAHRTVQLAERRAGDAWEDHGSCSPRRMVGRSTCGRTTSRGGRRCPRPGCERPGCTTRGTPRRHCFSARAPARVAMEILGHSRSSLTLGTH